MSDDKKIDDGGPAFPSEQTEQQDGRWNQTYVPGLSLRDYFAAKALPKAMEIAQAVVNRIEEPSEDGKTLGSIAAEQAFQMADEMIEARKR